MKNYQLLFIASFLLLSCDSKIKVFKDPEKPEYTMASTIIYGENSCLDKTVKTLPILELASDTILLKDSIKGNLFFSSGYLRKLATCNKMDYTIAFDVDNANGIRYASFVELKNDTISLSLPYDSLKLVMTTNKTDEYLLSGKLRASYFRRNDVKVFGYDTLMPVEKRIVVLKNK